MPALISNSAGAAVAVAVTIAAIAVGGTVVVRAGAAVDGCVGRGGAAGVSPAARGVGAGVVGDGDTLTHPINTTTAIEQTVRLTLFIVHLDSRLPRLARPR